jgi:hypothetical protein
MTGCWGDRRPSFLPTSRKAARHGTPGQARIIASRMNVNCPQCRAVYHSEEAHIGKHLRCTRCGAVVPVLEAARDVIRQTATPPPARSANRDQQAAPSKSRGRWKSPYRVPIIVGALAVLGVVGFVAYFIHTDAPRRGTASIADIEPEAQQQQPQTQVAPQDTNTDFQIVNEEPIPKRDKPSHVDDPRPTEYNSLPTGTRVIDNIDSHGHGELTVENGTVNDAVVCLNRNGVEVNETVLGFFVKSGGRAHIHKIPEGTYNVAFTTGLNWVEEDGEFSWHPAYSEFEHPFNFSEQRDADGVQYHSISVTLHAVPLGNVRTRTISREAFLNGHKHIALRR